MAGALLRLLRRILLFALTSPDGRNARKGVGGTKTGGGKVTEMQQAMRLLGNLPTNQVLEYNPGVWAFAGRVSGRLAYVTMDGCTPTLEQLANARSFGPRLANLRTRTWPTKEAALAALAEETKS